MIRCLFKGNQPGLTLGVHWMRWSDRKFFNRTAVTWDAATTLVPPAAMLVPMQPLATAGEYASQYACEYDATTWPNGTYVAFVWRSDTGKYQGFGGSADVFNGDDAPVFPPKLPTKATLAFQD